jgi:hypothetical protein
MIRTRHACPRLAPKWPLETSSKGGCCEQAKLYQEGVGYTKHRALIGRGCLGQAYIDAWRYQIWYKSPPNSWFVTIRLRSPERYKSIERAPTWLTWSLESNAIERLHSWLHCSTVELSDYTTRGRRCQEGPDEFHIFNNFVNILKFGDLIFDIVTWRQFVLTLLPRLPDGIFLTQKSLFWKALE